jgi:OmpA-OmpF porin, OOP family
MKYINKLFIVSSIFLTYKTANSQELTINLNGGLQGLDMKVKNGDNKINFGGKVGVGYTYFINKNWGIISGVDLGYFNNKNTLNNTILSSYQFDSQNDPFEYRIKTNQYSEKNTFYTASIPLLVQFRTEGDTQFYINAGARVHFPFAQKSKIKINQISTTGYYPDMNVEFENLPQHGFTTYNNIEESVKNKFKTAIALNVETGVSFKLSEILRLYTGVYLDYGLNNIQKTTNNSNETSLINYDALGSGIVEVNGLLKTTDAVEKTKLIGYGLQIKLGIDVKKSKKQEIIDQEITTPVEVEEVIATYETIEESENTISTNEKQQENIINQKQITEAQIKQTESPIVFDKIGDTSLTPADEKHLTEIAKILTEFPNEHIQITGHTCNIGTTKQNERVGLKRAQVVANYLESKGVNKNQISVYSQGDKQPLYPNNSETNRQKNRRTSILLVK